MKQCQHETIEPGCVHCDLEYYREEFELHRETLSEIKSIASDLYADRGEDAKTASACNQIMARCGL